MSSSVDNRIVSMEFDNQQFESGVSTTMQTLSQFKEALKFEGAEKGLQGIEAAAQNFNMDGIGDAVEEASGHFSVLEEIGIGALRRLGAMAVNTGVTIAKNLAKSFIVDPLSQGFSEYELKMNSVQTIMAGSHESMEAVNGYLEELNKYADQTIYSFSDMTSNIGKFTNAGVSLNDAVAAIKGISNEAALSGANANEASRAMYNFAQALSAGYVKLIDWKSIENANMATKEFKEELIKTALIEGTLVKEGDKFVSTTTNAQGKISDAFDATSMFNDSLNHQWMTTEVLTKTLARYSDATTDIGKRAYAAATEVKTFSQMVDTIKEAVGSGWAQTFEYLFGNLEQAKKLWTGLGSALTDIFAGSGEIRNDVLKIWSEIGGHDVLFEGVSNIGRGMLNVLQPVRDAINSIFGISGDKNLYEQEILRLAEGFLHLTESFKSMTEIPLNLSGIVEGLVAPFKFLLELVRNLAYAFSPLLSLIVPFFSVITNAAGGVGQLAARFFELAGALVNSSNIFRIINKLLTYIIQAGKTVIGGIGRAIRESETLSGIFDTVSSAFGKLKDFLKDLVTFEGLEQWVNDFGLELAYVAQDIVKFVRDAKIIDRVAGFFTPVVTAVQNFANLIGNAFSKVIAKVKEFIGNIDFAGKASEAFAFLKGWAVYIFNFIDSLNLLGKAMTVLNTLKAWITKVANAIGDFVTRSQAFQKIANWITPIINQIKQLYKQFGLLKTVGMVIGGIALGIKDLAVRLYDLVTSSGVLEKLSSMFWNAVKAIQAFGTKVYNVALPVIERLKTTFQTVKDAFGMMNLSKYFENLDFSSFKGFTTSVIRSFDAFTKSFAIRFKHLATLRGIADGKSLGTWIKDYFKSLIPEDGFIRDILDKLTGIKNKIVNFFKDLKDAIINHDLPAIKEKISGFFASIGEAIKKVARFLNDVDIMALAKSLSQLFLAFSLAKLALKMSGFFKMLSDIGRESFGTQIIKIAVAIGILAASMWALSQIPADKLQGAMQAMGELAAVMVTFTGIMGVMAKFGLGKDFAMGAGGLIGMTIAVGLMVGVIKLIEKSGINFETVISNAESFITVFGLLGALMLVAKVGGKNAWSAGVGLIAMSGAIFILVQDIKAIAKISQSDLNKGIKVIGQLMLIMGLVSALSRFAGANASKAGSMLLKMSFAIGILVICINALSKIDPTGLKRAETAIIVLMGVMGGLLAVSKLAENSAGAIMSMAVLLGVIAAALWVLAEKDWNSVLGAAAALSMVAVALGICFGFLGALGPKVLTALGSVIAMGVLLAAITGCLYVLSGIDAESNLKNAEALSLLAGVLTAVVAAFGAMGIMAVEGAVAIVASLTILFGGLMGLVEALGYLSQYATHMEEGFEFLNRLAKGIGEFIGNLIGSALESISNSLPAIGDNISQFAIKLRPFIGIVSQLPEGFGNKTGELATAMSKLTDAAIWGNVKTSFFGADMTTFAKNLKDFAIPFKDFIKEMSEIEGLDAAGAATSVMESMSAFAKDLPTGGFIGWLTGQTSIETFGKNLKSFGADYAEFAQSITKTPINTATVAKSVAEAVQAFASIQIENQGGALSWWVGDNDIATFGANLKTFGADFKEYATSISGIPINTATITRAVTEAITNLASVSIENQGGALSWWVGDNDIATFGENLKKFGPAFAEYAQSIREVPINTATLTRGIVSAITELASVKIENQGGALGWWAGENNIDLFGENLASFGKSFKEFSDAVQDVQLGKINAVINSLDGLLDFATKLSAAGGFGDAYGFDALIGQMTAVATTAVQALADEFTNSSAVLTTAITTMLGYITSALSLNQYLVTDQARLLCEAVILQFQTSLPDETFSRIGRGIILAFIDGILRTKQQAIQAATDLANATTEAVRSALPENVWYDIGAMAAQGLANGIRDKMNEVANAAIQAASEAVNAARQTLQVESPSKVFWQIGAYTMEGLANGITDNTSDIGIVADAAAREAIDAFSYVASVITAAMDDELNLSPLITPVLDLSNVQAGSETMNSLLGNANIAAGVSVPGYISPNSIAQLTASIESMAAKMQGQEKPNINIYVTGGDNANAEEIADEVINRINIEYQRQRAVWA